MQHKDKNELHCLLMAINNEIESEVQRRNESITEIEFCQRTDTIQKLNARKHRIENTLNAQEEITK